jgi:ELWxxDGT repeat protein
MALVCALASFSALARPTLTPIKSSFIGAAASSSPSSMLRLGTKVVFSANDATHGQELWVTDGTAAGTRLVQDLNPGSADASPAMVGRIGSAAIFTASDGAGAALWASDGASDAVKLMPLPPTSESGARLTITAADTRVYLLFRPGYNEPTEIFVTDGTPAGTRDLGAFSTNLDLTPIGAGGNLYFAGQDQTVGTQLWVSDGTTFGTHMVRRNVECPGPSCGPAPVRLFRIGALPAFVTTDGLWITDGSGAGTQKIAAIAQPAVVAFSPTSPRAYLKSSTMLWVTDGTVAGTHAVATPGTGTQNPTYATVLDDGRLLYLGYVGSKDEVWKSDGTAAGTVQIGTIPETTSYFLRIVGILGNRVLLAGGSVSSGGDLWAADLETSTVALVKDVGPWDGGDDWDAEAGAALGTTYLFPATDVYSGRELWQTDGSAQGTVLLANIAPDPGGGVVSGTVRAATDGAPLANVTVYLCSSSDSGSCDTVRSDAAGRYHFDGIIPATYHLAARSSAYLLQYYEGLTCPACPSASRTPVPVTAGMETSGVDFSLVRGGTISGSVKRASDGQPIWTSYAVIRDSTGKIVAQVLVYPDGSYQTDALPAGTYYAETLNSNGQPAVNQVYHNHDCPSTCDWHTGDGITVVQGTATTGIDFSLHAYGTIAGTIRDADGPVADRFVSIMRQGGTSFTAGATTDANGRYVSPPVAPGTYYVVSGGDMGYGASVYPSGSCQSIYNCTPVGGTPISVPVDGAITGIDLLLARPLGRIAGTIRDRTGAPISGINVALYDASGSYISDYVSQTTGTSGGYDFYDLPAGTYYLKAFNELYPGVDCFESHCNMAGATPLVVTNGNTRRTDFQLRSQRTTISGHVLDAVTGQPVVSTAFNWVGASGAGGGQTIAADGLYQISIVSRDASFYLSSGGSRYHYTIYRNARWECAFSPCPVPPGATPIPAGTNTNIDFLLERRGSVSGTITEAATGAPLQSMQILFYAPGGSTVRGSAATDANGRYWTNLDPGSYTAVAEPIYAPTHRSQVYRDRTCAGTCVIATGDVFTVADGIETPGIDFHLPKSDVYGTISGHVIDDATGLPMAGVSIQVEATTLKAQTDAQGFYSISYTSPSGLTTGQYRLSAQASQLYFTGLSGGLNCPDFSACHGNGTPVQVTAPNTTTVDFRMIKLGVTSLSPAAGSAAGGTQVTIHGTSFVSPATVTIGGQPATVLSVAPTQIVAVAPPGSVGSAHVTVRLSSSLASTIVQGFLYLPAVTFTDDPLAAGTTVVKAAHILELRSAVNALRAAAGLSPFSFTDASVSGGFIRAVHLTELRTALDQARAALGLPALAYKNTIVPGSSIQAADISDIRNGMR